MRPSPLISNILQLKLGGMTKGYLPPLTDRQVAVLAAIERRGASTLPDLRDDFPTLPPSAVLRSIVGLVRRELVAHTGSDADVYVGGVTFTPFHTNTRKEASMDSWLFATEQDLGPLTPGEDPEIFSMPPRDRSTGSVLRRADGKPYMPRWRAGEDIAVYHSVSERVVALLTATSAPRWESTDEVIAIDAVVRAYDPDGPTLADLGVRRAVQGGRQRLTLEQHERARSAFGLAPTTRWRLGGRRSREDLG